MVAWPSSEQGTRGFSRAAEGAENSLSSDVFTLAWVISEGKIVFGPMLNEDERALGQPLGGFIRSGLCRQEIRCYDEITCFGVT